MSCQCDHKFIDSTCCLRCGWLPEPEHPELAARKAEVERLSARIRALGGDKPVDERKTMEKLKAALAPNGAVRPGAMTEIVASARLEQPPPKKPRLVGRYRWRVCP